MTQKEKIKALFLSHQNKEIPCFVLANIALQYGARILELRREGMNIINRTQAVNGQKHSWFKYVTMEYVGDQGVML